MFTILVAEDNPANQKVIRIMLEKSGYKVCIVENGSSAIDEAKTGKYQMIFMDCQMPGMDGLEATTHIRNAEKSTPGNGRIPIVALTANSMKGDREKCLSAGMDDFMAKPFKLGELIEKINTWTHSYRRAQ